MANIFRGPSYAPSAGKSRFIATEVVPNVLLGLAALLTPLKQPFNQHDWPNPVRAKVAPQDHIWAGYTTRKIPPPAPFFQNDQPNPTPRAKAAPQDHIWAGYTTRNIPVVPPFFQNEHPNPYGKSRDRTSFYEYSGITTRGIPPPAPFYQNDQPNPVVRVRSTPIADGVDGTVTRGIPAAAALKAVLRDPYAVRVERRYFAQPDQPPNVLGLQALASQVKPFLQSEWPQTTRKYVAHDIPPNVTLYIPALAPIKQVVREVYAVRVDRRYYHQGDGPPNLQPFLSNAVAPAPPFHQNDWPITTRRDPQGSQVLDSTTYLSSGVVPPPPFFQTDWTNPSVRVRSTPQGFEHSGTTTRGIPPRPPAFFAVDLPTPMRGRYVASGFEGVNLPLTTLASTSLTLSGVSASGSVGFVSVQQSNAISGVSASATVGTVTPFIGSVLTLSGVQAVGSVGTLAFSKVTVPNVIGLPLGTAAVTLEASSLQQGVLSFQKSASAPVNTVISQNPVAGTLVFEDTGIALLISSGFVSPSATPLTKIRLPNLPNIIPAPTVPVADARGMISPVWWRFLTNVSQQAFGTNAVGPTSVPIPAGPSPFVFATPAQGTLLVNGGPVTQIEYSKDGKTWYPTGVTQGPLQLAPNDLVRISHINAPDLTFFQR